MKTFLSNHADKCYAVMRLIVGLLFACHGAQKLFGVLGGQSEIHDPEGLAAGLIEFGSGALIAAGLFTRISALFASGEIAVAYFKAHAGRLRSLNPRRTRDSKRCTCWDWAFFVVNCSIPQSSGRFSARRFSSWSRTRTCAECEID